MSNNQTDINSFQIYKLFFDDIEEIFLNKISFRLLKILTIITSLFLIGILLILIFNRSKKILLTCLIPFIYALIFYDFIQLLSLILLKYNFTEKYFNHLCQWTYYLKASSEAGQCLTIIFLFAISRHQIRYFLTHNHLPNSTYLHSRALAVVCLLFIIYINNWITHLKVEKNHSIILNETKHEINIEELSVELYDRSGNEIYSHQRFINDLDKYSQGREKNLLRQNQSKSVQDKIIHSNTDGLFHQIVIKISPSLFNQTNQTTKLNKTILDEQQKNDSYRINHCTYGQENFFLSNFLSLIYSITYFILTTYYLITVQAYKIPNLDINYHQQLYDKSMSGGRKKSAERHKQHILLIYLKQFLYLIIYSNTLFTFIRLIYVCLLTIILCLVQIPFKWLPVKMFFNSLFLIGYFSIPVRMGLLFIYLFLSHFSGHIQSIILYIFHTKLRFSWKFEKPTICFRLQVLPYRDDLNHDEILTNPLAIDVSSSIDENQSYVIQHDSITVYDENSSSYNGAATNIFGPSSIGTNELTSNASIITRL